MDAASASENQDFEAVIGLEVHVQLRTRTKMFCGCPSAFGGEPNTRVCEVCLGYPGALPVTNPEAVEQAVRLARALGARVHGESAFARKSYFYPDQPKGYQITQHQRPLATGGRLPSGEHVPGDDEGVPLRRLHLEEDAGKLIRGEGDVRIDFDRSGVPLVEIVTEPVLGSPEEAEACLRALHRLLLFTATSDAQLEEGSLRCDANVSLRRRGTNILGTRCEVKNLNSFRHVARALRHEIDRQAAILRRGDSVRHETRSFDPRGGVTRALRGKEGAPDYRYFPEPDLPPIVLSEDVVRRLEASLPELPRTRRERLVREHGLPVEEADVLVSSPELADYFDSALDATSETDPRTLGHWVRNEVLRSWPDVPTPRHLARLLDLVAACEISATAAKEVYDALLESGDDDGPRAVAERLELLLVHDDDALLPWIGEVLAEHPDEVERYREGKKALLGFFVGGVMRASGGAADPERVRRLLVERLERDAP